MATQGNVMPSSKKDGFYDGNKFHPVLVDGFVQYLVMDLINGLNCVFHYPRKRLHGEKCCLVNF